MATTTRRTSYRPALPTRAAVAWRPTSMKQPLIPSRANMRGNGELSMPMASDSFIWGVGGAGAGIAGTIVLDAVFPTAPLPTEVLGPVASAFIGYMVLDGSKGYEKRAMPWAIGALVPAAAYMIWGMFAPRKAA